MKVVWYMAEWLMVCMVGRVVWVLGVYGMLVKGGWYGNGWMVVWVVVWLVYV